MSSQDIATLLAAILGGILAILGGFIGALVTQRLARNEEKRTVVREKTEAVYDLSNQIDDWSSTQKSIVEKLKGIGNINALSSNSQGTLMPGESECSIDHVEMLIKLYIPSLMKQAEDISSSVSKMQALCETIKKNGRKVSDDNWNEAGSLDETIHAQVGQLQSSLINLVTY